MSDDERDFIQLCDSILDDGEVTPEEAYGIAEWLNDHPEIARSWPANGLVKPLQEIWADGSINRRELHRLARLLVSIQREWTQRPQQDATPVADRRIPAVRSSRISGGPRMPRLAARLRIPSWSEAGVSYDVDLAGPSCNCPEWRSWKSRLPRGHLSGCCKHILAAYAQVPRAPEVEEWLSCFIDNGWPVSSGTQWKLLTVDGDKVLFSTSSKKGWANVYAREDETYERFGYNVEEERWGYNSEPKGAPAIVEAIRSLDEARRRRWSRRGRNFAQHRTSRWRFGLNRWRIAVVLLLGFLLFFLWKNEDARQWFATSNVWAQEHVAAKPWTVTTTREIGVNEANGMVIPKGTQLRVIARAGKDLFVSYNGVRVTIPASATDLR